MLLKHGIISVCYKVSIHNPTILTYRFGHTIRGKPPGVALSLVNRLQNENVETVCKEESYVDIGFPVTPTNRRAIRKELRPKPILEPTSLINLADVRKAGETSAAEQNRLKTIAEHYGIYKDLFKYGYFVPRVPLTIKYSTPEYNCSVFNGNIIKPTDATEPPEVNFTGNLDLITGNVTSENYWSLILVNPDCKTSDTDNGENVHWFVANIQGNNIKNGDMIVPYFQPVPFKGLGYQRYIFVLFKQNTKIDFSLYKVENIQKLQQLNFNTEKFYRNYQDDITPAGLAFFQSNWDESVTDVFHKHLVEDRELYVEYDHPKPYIADQKWFPLKQPFNNYMEKYWSNEKANELEIKKHLKESHPFKDIKINLRFPHAQPIPKNVPSWLNVAIKKERLNIGRIESFKKF